MIILRASRRSGRRLPRRGASESRCSTWSRMGWAT